MDGLGASRRRLGDVQGRRGPSTGALEAPRTVSERQYEEKPPLDACKNKIWYVNQDSIEKIFGFVVPESFPHV